MIQILDLNGNPLDANCTLVPNSHGCTITFECRGGTRGSPSARNLQYMVGLDTVLTRLSSIGAVIRDAFLDTRTTDRLGLTHEARQLQMPTFGYPVQLSPSLDLIALRNQLCAAQRPIGRAADAKGAGNNTKRFTMVIEWGGLGRPSDVRLLAVGDGKDVAQSTIPKKKGQRAASTQGRGLSSVEKQAVEQHAMQEAIEYLSRDWPIVEDISRNNPCDLHCTRGSDELWVEVKGTTGVVGTVLLTRNEVSFARERHPKTALIVVHSIRLSREEGEPIADSGAIFVEEPWHPIDSRLSATQFEYRCDVPASNTLSG